MGQPCRVGRFAIAFLALTACGGHTVGDEAPADSDPGNSEPINSGPITVPTPRYPCADPSATTTGDGVKLLNSYRGTVGLGAVVEDPGLSAACLGHLRYLEWESSHANNGACLLEHGEDDAGNPYKTATNTSAGEGSLLACQRKPSAELPLARAVERWINSLYHRLPLLDPRLTRVGAASYAGYTCLYYADGIDSKLPGNLVLWPPNGMADVPTGFAGRETPCPTNPQDPAGPTPEQCPAAGFIVTATWYGLTHPLSFTQGALGARISYADDGSEVPLLALYAAGVEGLDPLPGGIPDTIAIVPSGALAKDRPLVVEMGSQAQSQSAVRWTFATGDREE